jgi:PKD repeat protein
MNIINTTLISRIASSIAVFLFATCFSFVFAQDILIPDEVIVRLNKGVSPERVVSQMPPHFEFAIDSELSNHANIWLFKFDDKAVHVGEVLNQLYKINEVYLAQVNTLVELRQTPNDPLYNNQWQHPRIQSPDAWDITTGGTTATGEDIVVCIIESANVMGHPDLSPNRWINTAEVMDGTDTDGNGYIDDVNGWNVSTNNHNIGTGNHGTQVAGMIGARGNNGVGVAGANWNVKMMVVAGYDSPFTQANIVAAYNYPLTQRLRWNQTQGAEGDFVVATNASWGVDGGNPNNYPVWCSFYNDLGAAGILNCGATTNNNWNVDNTGDVPTGCSSEFMIGVTATNNNDQIDFAGYGVNTIDVAAPGSNIYTTQNGGSGYGYTSGTSFASPLTAGVIGLMYSIPCESFMAFVKSDPVNAARAVRDALYNGVDQNSHLLARVKTGGRINAKKAIDILMDELCDFTPQPPTCEIGASATTITEGNTINFTDQSTGIPDSWSWTFEGGTPSSSTSQNPSGILFDTPGTYDVTLTASNSEGSCTSTIQITVLEFQNCDTLNFPPPGTLTLYTANQGFITGGNEWGDLAKAERFTNYSPYTHVSEMLIYLWTARDGGNGASVNFNVWNEVGGEPGTIISQVNIPLSQLDQLLPQGGGVLTVPFPDPVAVGGNPFYLGVEMVDFCYDAGNGCSVDSLAIVSNTAGDVNAPGTAWEQWADGNWLTVYNGWNAINNAGGLSLFVSATMTDLPPSASASVSDMTACTGQQLTFDAAGSQNVSSYEWIVNGANPNTGSIAQFNTSYTSPGTYTAYLIANGACGSMSIDSITGIVISDGIDATVQVTEASCGSNDGEIDIQVSGSGSYHYSIDNGASFQSSGIFSGLASGTYQVVVTDGGSCEYNETVTIDSQGGAVINSVNSSSVFCHSDCNGSIQINATGASLYSIDGGTSFQASNQFTDLCADTYLVVVDDGSGCLVSETVVVTEPSAISHSTQSTHTSCGQANGQISVNATGGTSPYEYSIDNGTSSSSNSTFNNLVSGTYHVVVIDANGCQTTTDIVMINASQGISLSQNSVDDQCNEGNGSINITASGGSSPYDYSWSPNVSSTSSASNLNSGTYTVTVSDNEGCSESITVNLGNQGEVNATASASSQSICEGQQVTLTATGGSSYVWTDGSGNIGNTASLNVNPSTTTTYTVTVTDGQCSGTASVTVQVTPVPVTTVSPEQVTICDGESATLTASGGSSYLWQSGESTQSITVSPSSQTTYTVVASNGSCAGNAASATVSVLSSPTAMAGADNYTVYLSEGATVNFTSSGSIASEYEWNFGDGATSQEQNPSHTYTSPGLFTVTLTVFFANGCSDEVTLTIEVLFDVSVNESTLDTQVKVYPNPVVDGKLLLDFDLPNSEDVHVSVINSIGQLVLGELLPGVQSGIRELDLSGYGRGIYFVKLRFGDEISVRKISIQ